MRKKTNTRGVKPGQLLFVRTLLDRFVFSIGMMGLVTLPFIVFFYYEADRKTAVMIFMGSIAILDGIIVGLVSLKEYLNREVITLKRRLAKIYISAIDKSPLNPNL